MRASNCTAAVSDNFPLHVSQAAALNRHGLHVRNTFIDIPCDSGGAVRRTCSAPSRPQQLVEQKTFPIRQATSPTRSPVSNLELELVETDSSQMQELLRSISGKWRVDNSSDVPSKKLWRGTWLIEEGGKAFFNGKRFGTQYDIIGVPGLDPSKKSILTRSDGWVLKMESDDQLVWSKHGEECVVWERVAAPSGTSVKGDDAKKAETKTELRSKMAASALQMSDGWAAEGRLSNAMAVIEELPKRITEDMQRAASYVVDNMQSEVAAVSKQILGEEARTGDAKSSTRKVIKNLEVIPTMVHNLLEARVEKAKTKVRHRVHGMIRNLSAIKEENWEDHEELVSQMRMISEEVEQIAGEAVRAAAQECRAHAAKQLECALTAMRDSDHAVSDQPEAHSNAEQPGGLALAALEMTEDPEFWSEKVADGFTRNTMEQAVAVVQDRNFIPHSFTNQVVADELLRARIRSGGNNHRNKPTETVSGVQSSRGQITSREPVTNPGSQGHPELCLRPCLYFAAGNCKNGNECSFCHMPHSKRPVRFDKLHRESLKKMPFGQFLSIILPVVKQKASDLDLKPDVQEMMSRLWPPLEREVAAGALAEEIPTTIPDNTMADLIVPLTPTVESRTRAPLMSSGASALSSATSATGSENASRSARKASFGGALQVMGFRALLSMLLSRAPEDQVEVRQLVETVLQTISDCNTHANQTCSETLGIESSWSEAGSRARPVMERVQTCHTNMGRTEGRYRHPHHRAAENPRSKPRK